LVQRGSIIPSISPQTGIGMPEYSYDHKTPVEAKILLLLGICGADPSDIELSTSHYEGDRIRILNYRFKQIHKDILDYITTIFLWEDDLVVEFAEITKLSFQGSNYRYRILEK